MAKFVASLERMLDAPVQPPPGEDFLEQPMPLPLPEHLKDAPRHEQVAYYQELLRHGEGMLELNREQMAPADVAEAEALMAELRKRLEGIGDAGTR